MWVNYTDVRSIIKTGDIFATTSRSWVSRLIRFFTRGSVSHVGCFVVIAERVFIIESMEGLGCRLVPASNVLPGEMLLIQTPNVPEDFMERAFADVGRVKYDYWGALKALFVTSDDRAQFCSEAVTKWLKLQFWGLQRGVLPQDIVNQLGKYIYKAG